MANKVIKKMDKETLLRLIDIYSKNWSTMDGCWFQSIESKFGMEEAMEHDERAWENYTVVEAKRIKEFLDLPPKAGIEGLKRALELRVYANLNDYEIIVEENCLIYRTLDCRVQNARKRKGMEFHPCVSVGILEYGLFAKTIDERFDCVVLSCYPEITDPSCNCAWKFTLTNPCEAGSSQGV